MHRMLSQKRHVKSPLLAQLRTEYRQGIVQVCRALARQLVLLPGLLLSLFSAPTHGVEVRLLDGSTVHASEWSLSNDQFQREGYDAIPLSDIDVIHLGERNFENIPQYGLLLKDGSWLPYRSIAPLNDSVRAESLVGTVDIPLGSVVGWGRADWIAAHQSVSQDLLHLDAGPLKVTVLGIEDGMLRVRSELSPDILSLPFDQVLGLRLALPIDRPRGIHLSSSIAPQQPPLRLIYHNDVFALQAYPKQSIDHQHLSSLIVHGERRVWLADLSPSHVEEEGAFGVVWHYAVNQNIDGSPLIVGGQYFSSGLVLHSKASLTWNLDGAYQRLVTQLGISDRMGHEGDCEVHIIVDGETRWHHPRVRGGENPHLISLDLEGAQELRILVDYGQRYDIGDHLALAGAWLLRAQD